MFPLTMGPVQKVRDPPAETKVARCGGLPAACRRQKCAVSPDHRTRGMYWVGSGGEHYLGPGWENGEPLEAFEEENEDVEVELEQEALYASKDEETLDTLGSGDVARNVRACEREREWDRIGSDRIEIRNWRAEEAIAWGRGSFGGCRKRLYRRRFKEIGQSVQSHIERHGGDATTDIDVDVDAQGTSVNIVLLRYAAATASRYPLALYLFLWRRSYVIDYRIHQTTNAALRYLGQRQLYHQRRLPQRHFLVSLVLPIVSSRHKRNVHGSLPAMSAYTFPAPDRPNRPRTRFRR